MSRLRIAVFFGVLLMIPLFAGCTSAPTGRVVLLQENIDVGVDLYAWADPAFTDPGLEGQVRRIRGDTDVPADVAQIGVRFAGRHIWTSNSSITLTVTDPAGNRALFLNGSIGQADDVGEIFSFWMFERVIPAFSGNWDIVMATRGNFGEVDFKLVGIERRATAPERGFTVSDDKRTLDLKVLLDGFGRSPKLTLVLPNGTAVRMDMDESGEQSLNTFKPQKGHYIVRAETTGWAGRIAIQAVQGG